MSAAGEAKPSRGPNGATPRDLGRPTLGTVDRAVPSKEADQ
jgi:hypothetical protein